MLRFAFHKLPLSILFYAGVLGLAGCIAGGGAPVVTTTTSASVSLALTDVATGATVTTISAGKPARVAATVRDKTGAAVSGVVVTFATSATLATMTPAAGTALSDAAGVAFIQLDPASLAAAGATTITATATVDGSAVSGSAGFGVLATSTGVTGISLTLTSPSSGASIVAISTGNPARVTATVRDAAGVLVPNTVVTFSTTSTLATMIPASGTALTDASGVASIQIAAASPGAAGASTVSAAASVGGASLSSSIGFAVIATSTGATGVSVALTNPTSGAPVANISSANPARVAATIRDESGAAVPNAVVTFSTTAALATLVPAAGTALTDASGVAAIQIVAASPAAAGAGTVTATATVGGALLSGSVNFSVVPTNVGAASISIALTDSITGVTRNSITFGSPAKVTAVVKDANGMAVPNAVVTFATTASLAAMTPAAGTALTDGAGIASIQIDPANPAAAGATTITATVTIAGAPVSSGANFSVIASSVGVASVTLVLTDPVSGVAQTNISSAKPARVSATVRDGAGRPVPNAVVTFATSAALVTMTPASGTALTNAAGVASIQIDPASPLAAGATMVSATVTAGDTAVSGSAAFTITATSVGTPGVTVALTDTNSGSAVSSISPGSPAKVKATVRNSAGSAVVNSVVTFSTNTALAAMTPSSGTALTDAGGVATIQIDAASLTAAGAASIVATATVNGSSVSGSVGFTVSAANAGLANMTVGTNPLSPYATTSVSVTVTGVPANTPVTINFSSICAGTGKATLPASVQTTNGVATATYTDKGCASTDTITASVAGLAVTRTATLKVNSPGAASIQFISATPTTIALRGTGGAGLVETSLVKFRVVDSNNLPVSPAVNVTFDLTTRSGGILLDGASVAVTKLTDVNGEASVAVQSGTTPTAVWVNASMSGTTLLTQSNQLRISTGRPAQDRFALSVGSHNIEGYSVNGVTTSVNVIASDRLGNPVPDGTAINFIAEGAQIVPSCATANGVCSVTFTSANPRPSGDSEPTGLVSKGRVTVVAYTLGEESFVDANGNNKYDSGETFTDLGDVFIDNNENGVWDAGEQAISYALNFQACANAIATSPSAPSKAATCDGVWGQAHVRQSNVIVLSGSTGFVNGSQPTASFIPGTTAPSVTYSMGGAGVCSNSFVFYAFDQNRNPLPSRTSLAASSPPTALGTVTIAPASVQDSSGAGGTVHSLQISKPSTTDATTGVVSCKTVGTGSVPLTVTMTTPNQAVTAVTFFIKD